MFKLQLLKNAFDLKKFFIKNLIKDEIVICMGAGSISNWIRTMIYNMEKNIYKNENLSKYNWFNLGGPAEILFKPKMKLILRSI